MAAGTKGTFYLFILMTGTWKQQPKGSNSNTDSTGWSWQSRRTVAFPSTCVLYRSENWAWLPPLNLTSHYDKTIISEETLLGLFYCGSSMDFKTQFIIKNAAQVFRAVTISISIPVLVVSTGLGKGFQKSCLLFWTHLIEGCRDESLKAEMS